MKALHFDGKRLRLRPEHPDPEPGEGQALVRVRMAGICSTDLQILRGYMAFDGVLGHEFVGEVEAGPEGWVGQRVVGEINYACGACPECGRGLGRHCPHRTVMGILNADGAFAERLVVPVANLHRVPAALSDEQAVFVEPLAAAFEIAEQVHLVPNTRAVVLGDGKLGLLIAQVLHVHGLAVTLVGKHAPKLDVAHALGIEAVPRVGFKPQPVDLVVEATGTEQGLTLAMQLVRPRGTLVLKSTVAAEHHLSLAPLVINEVTVIGSRCGPFAPALRALSSGRVQVQPLISGIYPLEDGLAAFDAAASPDTLKVLLRAGP